LQHCALAESIRSRRGITILRLDDLAVQSRNGLIRYKQKEILIKRKIHVPIGASGGAVDPKTHRKWVCAFIDAIAELVDEVVSFGHRPRERGDRQSKAGNLPDTFRIQMWLPHECREDNAEKHHQGLGIVTESWTRKT
jgi:hypothetical protein